MKKLFLVAMIAILQGVFWVSASAETGITATVTVADDVFTVSGETGAEKEVTILVKSPADVICYVDQTTSDANGLYSFAFRLPTGAESGEYTVRVGGEEQETPYQTTVTYDNGIPLLQATIEDAHVTVFGNLRTGAGKEVTILVQSPGGSIAYIDQTKSDTFGMYRYEFILPPSAANGMYTISVGGENVAVPYQTTVEYTGGLLPLQISMQGEVITVEGNLQNGAEKEVTVLVCSPLGNIAYIDQMATDAYGLYRFDFILPPMSANGIYTVNVGGEGVEEPVIETFTYTNGTDAISQTMTLRNITAGKERKLFIQGENMQYLEYKTFTLTYDPEKLKVDDLCVFTYDKEKETGAINGTHITVTEWNESTGHIRFKLNVPNGTTKWNGTLGGIGFTGLKNGNTAVRVEVITGR